MRLTPLEWRLRAPITPRLGGTAGRYRALANRSRTKKNKPTQNTKLRILPSTAFRWNDFGLVHRPSSALPLGYAITPGFPPPRSLPSYHAAQRLSSACRCSEPPTSSAIYGYGQFEPQHCVPRSRPGGRWTFGGWGSRPRVEAAVPTLVLGW
jgi:hypothetical protein